VPRREAASAVVPHHFIRRGAYDWDDPAKLVGSLVAHVPEVREPDGNERMHPATRLGLPPAQRRVDDIPIGLAALIEKSWQRIAVDPIAVDRHLAKIGTGPDAQRAKDRMTELADEIKQLGP
jgi:hypothetical protein